MKNWFWKQLFFFCLGLGIDIYIKIFSKWMSCLMFACCLYPDHLLSWSWMLSWRPQTEGWCKDRQADKNRQMTVEDRGNLMFSRVSIHYVFTSNWIITERSWNLVRDWKDLQKLRMDQYRYYPCSLLSVLPWLLLMIKMTRSLKQS